MQAHEEIAGSSPPNGSQLATSLPPEQALNGEGLELAELLHADG